MHWLVCLRSNERLRERQVRVEPSVLPEMAGQDRVRAEDFARFKQYDYAAVRMRLEWLRLALVGGCWEWPTARGR